MPPIDEYVTVDLNKKKEKNQGHRKKMDKQEAEKIIQQFEKSDPTGIPNREEILNVLTAMNVFTLHQISEFIMKDYLDNMIHNMKKI